MKQDHPKINFGKTGVLVINLGTPDSTSWLDIRKYLKEFLSDRRVIEVNPIIWQIILNLFILTFRPSKTAKAYKEIWMKEENMSPLLYYTKKQAEKISEVVRDLFRKNSQSEQSYSERQMFQVAIERLAREVAAVEKTDYFQSTEKIELILNKK